MIKIGIVGLGLIGGSIEKSLDSSKYEIVAVSKSQERDATLEDLSDCAVVFLCGEQTKIPKDLEKIARIKASGQGFVSTVITDVASTKTKVAERAQELGLESFVPGHPMAGTEKKGYESSEAGMFKDAKWVLGPALKVEENAELKKNYDILVGIIAELGAELVQLDASTHDKAVAVTSHLPLLLSLALKDLSAAYPVSEKVIGPGFEGMVRLANGNAELSREIMVLNRENIQDAWQLYKTHVDALLGIRGNELLEELNSLSA